MYIFHITQIFFVILLIFLFGISFFICNMLNQIFKYIAIFRQELTKSHFFSDGMYTCSSKFRDCPFYIHFGLSHSFDVPFGPKASMHVFRMYRVDPRLPCTCFAYTAWIQGFHAHFSHVPLGSKASMRAFCMYRWGTSGACKQIQSL